MSDPTNIPTGTDESVRGAEPKASPSARWFAILLGIALLAGTGVIIYDLWRLAADKVTSARDFLVAEPFKFLDYSEPGQWMIVAAVVLVIVGLIIVIAGLKPRRTTHHQLGTTEMSLWTRPVDVARMATATASRVTGVATAHSRMTKKNLQVTITGDETDATLAERVTAEVSAKAQQLVNPPQVTVRVRPRGEVS